MHVHLSRSLAELEEREGGESGGTARDESTVGLVAVEETGLWLCSQQRARARL